MASRRISVEIVGDSRSVERAFKNAGSAGSRFGSAMSKIGKTAAVGFGAAVVGMGFALKRGFGELAEAQKVAAQTNAVLRSTGGVANVSAKNVDRLATAISRMSGIDDEAIASAENLLLTFTGIRNATGKGNDIFNQATKATVDMATALGMDLTGAAMMVGKALNQMDVTAQGNVRGFMALRRVGVMVTPEMMQMAAAFIKAGEPMEAQKLLLRELMTEFGGSAQAFGTTMPGALGKLRNAFDELMAAFATGFLPIILKVSRTLTQKLADPAFVARVRELGTLIGTKLYNAFAAISQWFKKHWGTISAAFEGGVKFVGDFATAIGDMKDVAIAVAKVLARVMQVILVPFKAVFAIISGILTVMSKLPFIGGKFKGALEEVNQVRADLRATSAALGEFAAGGKPPKPKLGKGPKVGGGFAPGRQHGGPVLPWSTYRVGERGPETLVMGARGGHVYPGGDGGGGGVLVTGDITLQLDKHTVAVVTLRELQRMARSSTNSRSGRYGGQNPAIGLG